ncbi:MAG TPA: class I SAM-dependent methyltransferase [Solirubrobacteraceae bacterium]|nr:class I SAM-dependent methyltransferase [Solirubrobacteraceae bacterium]
MSAGTSLYDAVPYPGLAFAQTHPDRLATLGALFGLDAAPPAACRLLEIGCGDGGNLLPMAVALPQSTFVGIDSSADAIARARVDAQELGLRNVAFEEVTIEAYETAAGSFDYAVAHGVFSWVPEDVREALLALTARVLADHGIAYVSYNALPGARVAQTLRELLALKLEGIEDPARRIAEARRLLTLLSGPDGRAGLGAEATVLRDRPDALLFHDVLAPINQPFFFSEFARRAAAHELQYLAEANFWEMQAGMLSEELRLELSTEPDVVRQEQLLDYVKVRRFRQTLVCPATAKLDRTLRLERIAQFAVSAPVRAIVEDPAVPERVTFHAPGGSRLTTEHEVVVAVLRAAGEHWPGAVRVADVLGPDPSPDAVQTVCEALLRCFAANLVGLHVQPPQPHTTAGERPRAGALARLQARRQTDIANLRHATVPVEDELDRRLLALLDGTRDRAALLAELGPDVDAERLEASLALFARSSLLVA